MAMDISAASFTLRLAVALSAFIASRPYVMSEEEFTTIVAGDQFGVPPRGMTAKAKRDVPYIVAASGTMRVNLYGIDNNSLMPRIIELRYLC